METVCPVSNLIVLGQTKKQSATLSAECLGVALASAGKALSGERFAFGRVSSQPKSKPFAGRRFAPSLLGFGLHIISIYFVSETH